MEDQQQELYQCILAKPTANYASLITLGRKGLLPFVKTKIRQDLLLPCVLACGVPVKDVKTIKASLGGEITRSHWESFDILTREGAVIQKIESGGATFYSPVIQEMMKQRKLLKLR